MVHLFEDCNLCAIHAKRVTISESRWLRRWLAGGRAGGGARVWCGGAALCGCLLPQRKPGPRSTCSPTAAHPLLLLLLLRPSFLLTPVAHTVPKDMQLARRIRGPVAGVASF
jgi:hypothetical protein